MSAPSYREPNYGQYSEEHDEEFARINDEREDYERSLCKRISNGESGPELAREVLAAFGQS